MSLQTNDLRLSVHTNNVMDHDMFHVRIVVKAETIEPMLSALTRLWILGEHEYAVEGRYKVGQHWIRVEDGVAGEEGVDMAYGSVVDSVRSFWWNLERRGEEYFLDMSIGKPFTSDQALDGTTQLTDILPIDFWIEPAAFIRSMTGKAH